MRICIIDDMAQHTEELEHLLRQIAEEDHPDLAPRMHIDRLTSGMEAVLLAEEGKGNWDYLFVDIQLRNLNGIDLAGELSRLLPAAEFVFISGYDDYYLDVYDVPHLYFLRKPFDREHTGKALRRMVEHASEETESYFSFRAGRGVNRLPLREIRYFESQGRQILIHTEQNQSDPASYYGSMRDLAAQIPPGFIRCHSSYIVNLERIEKLLPDSVVVGGQSIPVSRRYRSEMQEKFYEMVEGQLLR